MSLQIVRPLPSIVNRVSLYKDDAGRSIVKKCYPPLAHGTGIPVPRRRSQIERRVLSILHRAPELQNFNVRVPQVLYYSDRRPEKLYLEYLPGTRVDQLKDFPHTINETFFLLGSWIAKAETILTLAAPSIFDKLFEVQTETRLILNALKGNPPHTMAKCKPTVSLGDVSATNLLLHKEILSVIDFDFCHLSAPARDVGQLAAQLCQIFACANTASPLFQGYKLLGGNLHYAEQWKEVFMNYYANRREDNHAQ